MSSGSMFVGRAIAGLGVAAVVAAASPAYAVTHATGAVKGVQCDIWTWTDSAGKPRTVALKMEGHGNAGHGGYAIQMTYYRLATNAAHPTGVWQLMTASAPAESDGGFGYFVSHERYRYFADNRVDTIASKIFHKDDSPLGLGFAATSLVVLNTATAGAQRFTINYGHYGTTTPWQIDDNTGEDKPLLPANNNNNNYAFYTMPVATTWTFQDARDYPRIDVLVSLNKVIPPGGTKPAAGLVSFDMRGPYEILTFDNNADGIVGSASWGDQTNLFAESKNPVTRNSPWTWNAANNGARYNLLVVGNATAAAGRFEMGLYEPFTVSRTRLTDGYSGERSFTSSTYTDGSEDQCGDPQTLPSDGEWPYQSIQYSLPCKSQTAAYLTTPTDGKKIAWGSTSYYGTLLTSSYNGYKSLPLNAFPANGNISYSVCLVLGWDTNYYPNGVPAYTTQTQLQASRYTKTNPNPASDCATVTP